MTAPVLLPFPGEERRAVALSARLGAEIGVIHVHRFPDGESLVRVEGPVHGRPVVVLCGLERPDPKVLPLLFALQTIQELGAISVGLVAPYLAYMRQDRAFHEGEAVAARLFARLLSQPLDWLVTVDPHLHRISSLGEVYPIPTTVVHAAPAVAAWVREHVPQPLFVGPDEESSQWVSAVAARADAPWIVLRKQRRGDRDVEVSLPEVERWRDHRPVLVDDILSTGRTLAATAAALREAGLPPAIVVAVHGLFAGSAAEDLARAGIQEVITTNAVRHPTNRIDLDPLLGEAIRLHLAQRAFLGD